MKSRPLLAQVLAVNLLLVAATVLVATIALNSHVANLPRGREAIVFGLATVATLAANWLLLHRRFRPLDELISEMERMDLSTAGRELRRRARGRQRGDHAPGRGVSAHDGPPGGRAPPRGPGGHRGSGARARAHRPRPARRGQPGPNRRVAAPGGLDCAGAARAALRARGDQAPVRSGHGGAARHRAPAAAGHPR